MTDEGDYYEEDPYDGYPEAEPPDQYQDGTNSVDWAGEEADEGYEKRSWEEYHGGEPWYASYPRPEHEEDHGGEPRHADYLHPEYGAESRPEDYDYEDSNNGESYGENQAWHGEALDGSWEDETDSEISYVDEEWRDEEHDSQYQYSETQSIGDHQHDDDTISELGGESHQEEPYHICFSGHDQGPEAYLRWEKDMDEWFQENQIPEEERTIIAEETLIEEAYLRWDQDAYLRLDFDLPDHTWAEMKQFLHKEFVEEPSTEPYYTRYQIPQEPRRRITAAPSKKSSGIKPRKKSSTETFGGKPKKPTKKMPHVPKGKRSVEKEAPQLREVEVMTEQREQAKSEGENQLEPLDQRLPGESYVPLSSLKVICYKCQGLGHIAKVCPFKSLTNDQSLELKRTSLKDCGNSVEINIPNASISHLSLPKDVETGLGKAREEAAPTGSVAHTSKPELDQHLSQPPKKKIESVLDTLLIKEEPPDSCQRTIRHQAPELGVVPAAAITVQSEAEQGTRQEEKRLEKRPLDHAKNTKCVQQVSFSATPIVSHDATTVLKSLLNIQWHEETPCLKTRVRDTKDIETTSLPSPKEPMMHLFLGQNVNLISGTKEADHKGVPPREDLLLSKTQDQRKPGSIEVKTGSIDPSGSSVRSIDPAADRSNGTLDPGVKESITKGETAKPNRSRGVILSYLLKEEPPDVPSYAKPLAYPGKTLNYQGRMKANLLSFGTGQTVLRTKLSEGGGDDARITSDAGIRSSPAKEHGEDTQNDTDTRPSNYQDSGGSIDPSPSRTVDPSCRTVDLNSSRTVDPSSGSIDPSSGSIDPGAKEPQGDAFLGAYRPNQKELSYESNCSRNSTHQAITERKNWSKSFPQDEVIQLPSWQTAKDLEGDPRLLIEGFQSNQDEPSCKPTCFGNSTHQRSTENWIHTKITYGLKVIQLLNQEMPDLPYLEAHGLNYSQPRLWRPGEAYNHTGGPPNILPCTSSQRIRRTLLALYFPYLEPFAFKHHPRLPLLLMHDLEVFYTSQKVPRHHLYLPKLSRYKGHSKSC